MLHRFYHPDNGNLLEVIEVEHNSKSISELHDWLLKYKLSGQVSIMKDPNTGNPKSLTIRDPKEVLRRASLRELLLGNDSCYIALDTKTGHCQLVTSQVYNSYYFPLQSPHYLMQLFAYKHLPIHLQEVSKPICELAEHLDKTLPNNPEKTTALRKLREAKDCAVTAVLFK